MTPYFNSIKCSLTLDTFKCKNVVTFTLHLHNYIHRFLNWKFNLGNNSLRLPYFKTLLLVAILPNISDYIYCPRVAERSLCIHSCFALSAIAAFSVTDTVKEGRERNIQLLFGI